MASTVYGELTDAMPSLEKLSDDQLRNHRGDKPILANAHSLAGDCYMKLGRDVDARNSYNLSLKEDMYVNFWGMSRLIGN